MTGEPMHTASEMTPRAPIIIWKVKYPLRFVVSYFQPVMQHFEQELYEKHLCNSRISKEMVPHAPGYINNYRLKSEVSIMLCCRLCSTHYTAVRIKNCLKSTSAIKIATMTNMDDFYYEGKPLYAIAKPTLFVVSKDEWDTKEDTGKSMKKALYVLR